MRRALVAVVLVAVLLVPARTASAVSGQSYPPGCQPTYAVNDLWYGAHLATFSAVMGWCWNPYVGLQGAPFGVATAIWTNQALGIWNCNYATELAGFVGPQEYGTAIKHLFANAATARSLCAPVDPGSFTSIAGIWVWGNGWWQVTDNNWSATT